MKTITRMLLGLLLITVIACNSAPQQEAEETSVEEPGSTTQEDVRSEFEKMEENYFHALARDPDGFKVNYALGLLYYNEAVDQLAETDSIRYQRIVDDPKLYDKPLEVLFSNLSFDDVEGRTYALFNRAIVHFERAHAVDSTYPHLLEGMSGCYFAQHKFQEAAYYKKRAQEAQELQAAAKAVEVDSAQ